MTAATKPKAPRVSKSDIETYLDLEERRKELEREAKELKQRAAPLKEKFKEAVKVSGKDSIKKHGHLLTVIKGKALVKWREEFLKVADEGKAAELESEAPRVEMLQVRPTD